MENPDLRNRLEALLKEPIVTSSDARKASKAADLLAGLLQIESEANQLLAHQGGSTSLHGVSLHEAAEVVLVDAGTPLHASVLADRIRAHGWRHPRSKTALPEQLYHQISARLPLFPDVFRKVAPATWALVSWDLEEERSA